MKRSNIREFTLKLKLCYAKAQRKELQDNHRKMESKMTKRVLGISCENLT
jgi:hypothetical protein